MNALTTEQHIAPMEGKRDKKSKCEGVSCSSAVRAFAHDVMRHRFNPSWWTHWAPCSSLCSTTSITKTVICVILSVGWCL